MLQQEINRVKEEWDAIFDKLITKGSPQTPQWQHSPGPFVSGAASAHGNNLTHRCSVTLTAEQAQLVRASHMVRRAWFGDGKSVPVKNTLEASIKAYEESPMYNPHAPTPEALLFFLPLGLFHEWMHGGVMKACPWVDGYRIAQDIDLTKMTRYWLHSFHDS